MEEGLDENRSVRLIQPAKAKIVESGPGSSVVPGPAFAENPAWAFRAIAAYFDVRAGKVTGMRVDILP
jgi:hypothetical protein